MSILKISRLGHPILLEKCQIVEKITSNETKRIIHDMTDTMLDSNGIGLAAPQVHINKQIIIFRTPEEDVGDEIKITALINPRLTIISKETENEWEGCLSIPGMLGLVKRYSKIKYKGNDMNGNVIEKEVDGMHARVVQHEYDHLMGILYIDRLFNKNAYGFSDEIKKFWQEKEENINVD